MNVSPSAGNVLSKSNNAFSTSGSLSGAQAKASTKSEPANGEIKTSPRAVEVKPVVSQKSVVSNQVANPDSKGVDITA